MCDNGNKRVQVLTSDGSFIASSQDAKEDFAPKAVCVSKDQHCLIVADWHTSDLVVFDIKDVSWCNEFVLFVLQVKPALEGKLLPDCSEICAKSWLF